MAVPLRIMKLEHYDDAMPLPTYQTDGSVGMDVRACLTEFEDNTLTIPGGQVYAVPTGLSVCIPDGYELQVRPRSGFSLTRSFIMPNAPGTIDNDYRGETRVILRNCSDHDETICHGDRIAQWVVAPVCKAELLVVESLPETTRGSGGFGSTGLR